MTHVLTPFASVPPVLATPTNQLNSARRDFVLGSAKLGGCSMAGVIGLGSIAASSAAQAAQATTAPDLLFGLGSRIAVEITNQIGPTTSGYSVHFLDCAGPSCDGIRLGLAKAMSVHGVNLQESQADAQGRLATVTIRNLETGRQAEVELFPEALSQVALVEGRGLSAHEESVAMLNIASEALFRTTFV